MKINEEEGLDKIFKQGLSKPGHLADYRESDWDAFEQMLDEKDNKRPVIFWLRIAGGIAAMLLLGFGWLYMQNSGSQPVKVNNIARQPVKVKGAVDNAEATTSQNTIAATAAHKDNTGTSGGLTHQSAGGLNNTPSSVKHTHILAMDRPYRKNKSFFTLSPAAARRDNAGLVNDDAMSSTNTQILAAVYGEIFERSNRNISITFPDMDKPENSPITKFTDPVLPSKRRAQFAITVLAAPNINGVSSFNQAEVGANLGLQFSVSVSKFTFTTGAVYAKTPYLTPFDSYHTNYPFKFNPSSVSADCRVLDIPLNIDYKFYSKARNSFSVGSGLSSYIMLSENYHYNYAKPYNYTPTDYDIVNQNQHFFGVLNLSATYQRKLNSKFSLDVQPYLKIPLTGIGYSKVDLQTAGVAVGLSWNLNSLTKP